MTALRFLSFALAGPCIGALVWSCSPLTATGELGNGQFTYVCSQGSVDTACSRAGSPEASVPFEDSTDGGSGTTTLPHVIAVGAAFTVTYAVLTDYGYSDIQGDSGYSVTPASTQIAAPSGDSLVAKRTGYVALLAFDATTQTVDDFVLVSFQPIASLTPSKADVTLSPGSVATLSVTAEDAAAEALGGRLACSWSFAKGASALAFKGPTNGAAVEVEGLSDGDSTARVTCGSVTAEVLVHVTGTTSSGDGGFDGSFNGDGGSGD